MIKVLAIPASLEIRDIILGDDMCESELLLLLLSLNVLQSSSEKSLDADFLGSTANSYYDDTQHKTKVPNLY